MNPAELGINYLCITYVILFNRYLIKYLSICWFIHLFIYKYGNQEGNTHDSISILLDRHPLGGPRKVSKLKLSKPSFFWWGLPLLLGEGIKEHVLANGDPKSWGPKHSDWNEYSRTAMISLQSLWASLVEFRVCVENGRMEWHKRVTFCITCSLWGSQSWEYMYFSYSTVIKTPLKREASLVKVRPRVAMCSWFQVLPSAMDVLIKPHLVLHYKDQSPTFIMGAEQKLVT